MTSAHWHLVLNHIPLLGLLFGSGLLAYGLFRAEDAVQRASLGLLAVAGLAIIAVYLTGEPAEEIVEGMAAVSHDAIEAHEELGWYALVAGVITGIASLGALLYGTARRRLAQWTVVLTLLLALASAGLIGYTANLGGKISHPELRSDPPVQSEDEIDASQSGTEESEAEEEEHDEE